MTTPPTGWKPDQGYLNPFPSDRPLLTITSQNLEAHRADLAPGLQALLQKVSGFSVPVYPSRRTATFPKEVLDSAIRLQGQFRLDVAELKKPVDLTVPFREPKTGEQVMWNVLLRYAGGNVTREGRAYPVRANGETYAIGYWSRRVSASHLDQSVDDVLFVAMGGFTTPAALRGNTALVREMLQGSSIRRSAWFYTAAQRRVRRAPDLAFDSVSDGTEGMVVADQVDGFNGSLERYDWKLVGKRSMIVPYNTYAIGEPKVTANELIRKGSVNSDLMRYEMHRVWVVEASLKAGQSHLYPKRRFYIDEDSWTVLMEEAYSKRGELWRVALHGLMQLYDAQYPTTRISIYHDLDAGSYFVSGLDSEKRPSIRFGDKARMADFLPDSLGRFAAGH
jgi:hypothetical protein